MKKLLVCFLIISILISAATFSVSAEEVTTDVKTIQASNGSTITYFDDGSFLEITTVCIDENNASTYATAKTITSGKTASYTDADGVLQWEYTLTATFSYVSGISSTCTSASYTKNIYDSDWSFSNGSATKIGNVAKGAGEFSKTVFLFFDRTYEIDISLTCDTYGNVT